MAELCFQTPEIGKGVRLIHFGDIGDKFSDVDLSAQFIEQREPLKVRYSISGSSANKGVKDNFFSTANPADAVRQACVAARASNKGYH